MPQSSDSSVHTTFCGTPIIQKQVAQDSSHQGMFEELSQDFGSHPDAMILIASSEFPEWITYSSTPNDKKDPEYHGASIGQIMSAGPSAEFRDPGVGQAKRYRPALPALKALKKKLDMKKTIREETNTLISNLEEQVRGLEDDMQTQIKWGKQANDASQDMQQAVVRFREQLELLEEKIEQERERREGISNKLDKECEERDADKTRIIALLRERHGI